MSNDPSDKSDTKLPEASAPTVVVDSGSNQTPSYNFTANNYWESHILPPASEVALYEKMLPGFASKLDSRIDRLVDHKIESEKQLIKNNTEAILIGKMHVQRDELAIRTSSTDFRFKIVLGVIFLLSVLGAGVFLCYAGQTIPGTVLLGVDFLLVAKFVFSDSSSYSEGKPDTKTE